ncbi:hypothetical protein CRG98_031770 [Punica granatum]|uniref:Uncharacterized protein n=1 Tax=Punica granatum TaxID=22663 RepID=A0A2I0IUZ2_PUNGR|nr:hypothetical protein CRG98_031770 [Punica granatum]
MEFALNIVISQPKASLNKIEREGGSLIGSSNPEATEDSKSEVPSRFGVRVANRRPRPLHRGRRYPRRTPVTSVEGWGRRLAAPTLNQSRTPSRRSSVDSRLGPPIG